MPPSPSVARLPSPSRSSLSLRPLERVQLARALAERQGRRLGEVEDWRPLLRFTQGNPLTITVLVGQALRDGLLVKKDRKTGEVKKMGREQKRPQHMGCHRVL